MQESASARSFLYPFLLLDAGVSNVRVQTQQRGIVHSVVQQFIELNSYVQLYNSKVICTKASWIESESKIKRNKAPQNPNAQEKASHVKKII